MKSAVLGNHGGGQGDRFYNQSGRNKDHLLKKKKKKKNTYTHTKQNKTTITYFANLSMYQTI